MGKYTAKKNNRSHYKERLEARGISSAQVRMPFIDSAGRKHSSMDGVLRSKKSSGSTDYKDKPAASEWEKAIVYS